MFISKLALFAALQTCLLTACAAPGAVAAQKRSKVQVVTNCKASGDVAMTFDDGPYIYEADVARNLGDAKGTFFLNGNNYACIYDHVDEIRALHAAGHTLGSHTWSHPHLNSLSWDQIHDELWKVELAFQRILGLKPLLFRPPYGEYNDLVISVLQNRGYRQLVMWSDDTEDASGASLGQSQGTYDNAARSYPAPHIILDHSVLKSTAQQLVPYGANKLRSAGYRLVSIDTCMADQGFWPYKYIGEPQQRDGSWTC